MNERKTLIKLTDDLSIARGWGTATAAGHKVVRVGMSKELYKLMVDHRKYDAIKADLSLYQLRNLYDPTRSHGGPLFSYGVLLGVPVFLEVELDERTLVLISVPKDEWMAMRKEVKSEQS
jgi:hypothetical protein